ncbi:DUF4272 domain-containing protein [Rhizorhabdus histidinilytica]|uniref:DUF4272 domain-containing protein n=1 Tax=Rhizorhabdus histidinilytica TaxID=439228 RepID=UPI0032207401
MTGVFMTRADLTLPVLGFPQDGDVMPFEDRELLLGKTGWLASRARHLGLEIVDSAERRWVVSGLVPGEPPRKKWWRFGRADSERAGLEVELHEIEREDFIATRARVEVEARDIFEEGDEALAAIRAASTMAELSKACFEITVRGQGCRILSGDPGIPIRPASEVASRALLLFAIVRLALGVERSKIVEWLQEQNLLVAMSPEEAELFTTRRVTEQQRTAAGWELERLIALLWALGLADMSPAGEDPDLSTVVEIVPPAGDMSIDRFLAAELKPARDIAAMAERYRNLSREAGERYAGDPSDKNLNEAEIAERRYVALQWIINPDRISWR